MMLVNREVLHLSDTTFNDDLRNKIMNADDDDVFELKQLFLYCGIKEFVTYFSEWSL